MRIFKNSVLKGIQNDLDFAITPAENYIDAQNLTLSGDNKFLALTNIKGTQELQSIVSSFSGRVLGVFANKYSILGVDNVECLTIFVSVSNTLTIYCYDLQNDTTYSLFQDTYSGYDAAGTQVDSICYPENGLDRVYFTDNFNEIRKLRCEIPSPYVANFLEPEQLSLQRRGTIASLNLDSIQTSGGSLLCGSYQFSLRFYNEDRQSYTKWTIPSTPWNISQVTSNVGLGSYNAVSAKYMRLRIDVPTEEFDLYTHYQLAVIENTQSANSLNASLLKLEDLTIDSVSGGFTTFYHDYKSNVRIDFVPITDIVVDLAAISHVKTLQVKNNKLFAGNITYTNLEYDRTPTVSGSIQRVSVDPTNDYQTSTRRGMWRDEVYRYYVSYYDSKYNFSNPKMLDMSAITGNQVANGDLKTPSKKLQSYTLLDGSSNKTNLNLSITIDSHPTWARGFVILRAKRKARVKFQTPFVPSCLIEGIDVIGNYPTEYTELGENSTSVLVKEAANASPMNPVGTHIPKNFFFPVKRDYVKVTADNASIGLQSGEVMVNAVFSPTSSNKLYFGYPPETYITASTTNRYNFSDGDKFEAVDYAFLKLAYTSYQTNATESNVGNFLETSVNGTFYATQIADYYYSNATTRSDPGSPVVKTGKIVGFKDLDNLGEGTQLGGNSICEFNNLETTTVYFQNPPSNQRSGVFQLDNDKIDTSYQGAGSMVSSSGGSVALGFYELGASSQSNTFTPNKVGFVENSSYVSIVDIVNVTTEQSDDRYGDPEDLHDIVFTGANYAFNTADVATIQASGSVPITIAVAGGDCITSLHQFKVTDSHYGLINVEKSGAGAQLSELNLLKRWGKVYNNRFNTSASTNGDTNIAMPVPYRNVSQVLAVVIESEINGEVLAPRVYPINNGLQDEDENEYNLRTPFTYLYNINYSAESNQKAFIPYNPDAVVTTEFKARGVFSDQKIYNTFIEGFDVFRASSTFDLEETYGGITKLVLTGDELYALQERAISYLPVDAQLAETTNGDVISLRSSIVVDIPRYLSRQYGCQHLKGVSQIDNAVLFPDGFNKSVIRLQGDQIDLISENGMVKNFQTMFEDNVAEGNIVSVYDNKRRQYWIACNAADNTYCWVWDDRIKVWVSNYEFATGALLGGVYTNNEVHLMGLNSNLNVYKMYSGVYSSLMGTTVTPRVTFSVNPEFEAAKTFDDLVVYSSGALATGDMSTETDSGTSQSVSGMNLALMKREGSYRLQTLRDSGGGRLRGLRAILLLKWGTSDSKVSLNSVITKYRNSEISI